jgi:hypothetical protein
VFLSEAPTSEATHESAIIHSANQFVLDPKALSLQNFNATEVLHKLFCIGPKGKDEVGRQILVADIATDHIRAIISYAIADATAQERTNFYYTISKEPKFSVSLGKIFKHFVLTWLASDDLAPLPCTSINTHSPQLTVSACGWKGTQKICGSLNDLQKTTVDTLPLCFLPSASVDAIIFTEHFIITIQITNSRSQNTKKRFFSDIKKNLPTITITPGKKAKQYVKPPTWCHVFITDHEKKTRALRHQKLTELPRDVHPYSAVFDVDQFKVKSEHMRHLDEVRVRAPWLHTISTYWGLTSKTPMKSQTSKPLTKLWMTQRDTNESMAVDY